MNNKIEFITTTSTIEGWSIQKYLGIVTYQLVIGANIFHDVFASFRDIFGGNAKAYQKDLQNMEEIALENLKKKASFLGANIIIGLRLDFDEVSGGGKTMFMLSASGTAVMGKSEKDETIEEQNKLITYDTLNFEINRERFREKVFTSSFSIQINNDIEKLLEYKIDAVEKVMNYIDKDISCLDENKDLINEYFLNVNKESIDEYLKSESFLLIKNKTFKKLLDILEIVNWFDYDVIFTLLKSDNQIAHNRALYLLGNFENDFYSKDDIQKLAQLIELLSKTFKNYPILQISKGMFGKEKDMWKCMNCGTMNPKESNTCTDAGCSANIYGIPFNKINPEGLIISLKMKSLKLKQLLDLTNK